MDGKYEYRLYPTINKLFDYESKQELMAFHTSSMINKMYAMFKYKGLPDSIPQRDFKLMLQLQGHATFLEYKGDIYALHGRLGGRPNPYYMPTISVVANPALNMSKELVIDKDCVIVPHDPLYLGLTRYYQYYATMLTENAISRRIAIINMRIMRLLTAPTPDARKDLEDVLKSFIDGKLSIALDKDFMKQIQSLEYGEGSTSRTITQLIENEQYTKASFFNDMGLQANYNMKRESINSNEAQLNEDSLLPFIDTILECQSEALEKVNKHFGLNISVERNSSWKLREETNEATLSNLLDNDKGGDEVEDKEEQSESVQETE